MTDTRYASAQQFHKAITRMMPTWASETGEGKLIAAILSHAWAEGKSDSSRRLFNNETRVLEGYCSAVGLEWKQIAEFYKKHCIHSPKSILDKVNA